MSDLAFTGLVVLSVNVVAFAVYYAALWFITKKTK